MQPQGDSIWGNINLCIEIALNIYYLCGEKGEGIVIPKEQAEKDFSPETVAAGKGVGWVSLLSQRGGNGNVPA